MKKSQIMGQIFVYVLAGIMFALILGYGYRAVNDFLARADQVTMIELRTELKSSIRSVASSQDVERKTFHLPTDVKRICFVDLTTRDELKGSTYLCDSSKTDDDPDDYNPIICDSWIDNVPQNVFLVPKGSLNINVGKITLPSTSAVDIGYLCLDATGAKVSLRLEGRGDRTMISEWEE